MKCQVNINKKISWTVNYILILKICLETMSKSDKIDLNIKSIRRDREKQNIMIKYPHLWNTAILNSNAPNKAVSKFIKQKIFLKQYETLTNLLY